MSKPIEAFIVFGKSGTPLYIDTEENDVKYEAEEQGAPWKHLEEDGYTCRRVQLSDPKTHVVVSREDLLTLLNGIDPFDFYDEELLQKMRKLLEEHQDGE